MLSLLSAYDEAFGPLRVLRYITFRTLLAAGTAALISATSTAQELASNPMAASTYPIARIVSRTTSA